LGISLFDNNDYPNSQQIIDSLVQTFKQKSKSEEIQAAAICFDGSVIPPGQMHKVNFICIGLGHKTNEAIDVFIPYQKVLFGKFKYGELFAVIREPQFFNHSLNNS
jgi:hypothetical protein